MLRSFFMMKSERLKVSEERDLIELLGLCVAVVFD
jgi:hypothetical protein